MSQFAKAVKEDFAQAEEKQTKIKSNEVKQNETERLDTKRIPDETARRWIAEKLFEEFGTVANDLQLNTDKLIAYYNAGTVKK